MFGEIVYLLPSLVTSAKLFSSAGGGGERPLTISKFCVVLLAINVASSTNAI